MQDTSIGLLTPIFFVTAGFQVSFGVFQEQLGLIVVIFLAAVVGKALGTALFYLPSRHGWRESLVIGVGMNGRGGVDIVLIGIALEMGIIQQDTFSILVFMALMATATVPVTLKAGMRWLTKRGEMARPGSGREGVVIVGAGPLARALARTLEKSQSVILLDTNANHCIVAKSEGLTAILGSALHEQILSEAQAGRATTLIAMTPNAEINRIVAQTAREVFQIPDVHVLQGGSELGAQELTRKHLQIEAVFARAIELEEWDHWISHGEVTFVTTTVDKAGPAAAFATETADEVPSVVLAVRRGTDIIPVHERTALLAGDEAFLVCAAEQPVIERDRFDETASVCPVLDLTKISSAEDFFEVVAGVLAERLGVDEASLARSFVRGEQWSSTVVAPGIAIPHVSLPGQHPFQLLIARSQDGLHFPNEEEPVHIIFVLVSTHVDRNFHLRALSAIAQIVQNETFEKRWMSAEGPEALRRIVLSADRRRLAAP